VSQLGQIILMIS